MMPALARRGITFGGRARWLARLNTAAGVFLAVYIVAVANIIVFRHPLRVDLTEEGLHSLSRATLAQLELVREPIRVIVPYYQQPRNPKHLAEVAVIQRAVELLKEYTAHQPLVDIEAKVNIYEEADRWTTIRAAYDLSETLVNRLIFVAGEGKNSYRQTLTPADLAVFEAVRDPALPQRVKEFRGERAITSAIMKLVHRERKKAYFLQGHGELELSPGSTKQGGGMPLPGLGPLRHDLESSGFEAAPLSLFKVDRVPADCSVLVIAGPRRRFAAREVDVIERYLLDDGCLFVALSGARTGLEDLLEKWGIRVRDEQVRARIVFPGERLERNWVPAGAYNETHPITSPFETAARFDMLLWLPRVLDVAGGQTTMKTEPLFSTGPNTENEKFFLTGGLNAGGEEKGEGFVLAAAAMPVQESRPPPDWEARRTRLVVVGADNPLRDAEQEVAIRGGYLSASHRDFFMNSIYWLAGEETLMAASGMELKARMLPVLRGELRVFLLLASVVVFPGIFALVGVGIYFLRRA